ncbi:MAG: hypothetical protein AB9921_03160 [Erysipelotrichaceae bacterium]
MATTDVSTSSLTAVAKNVNELVLKYNKSVERIYEIGSEIDAMWDGDANKKFIATLGADRERFNAMSVLLSRYTEVLNETAQVYAKAESEVLEIVTTNKVR